MKHSRLDLEAPGVVRLDAASTRAGTSVAVPWRKAAAAVLGVAAAGILSLLLSADAVWAQATTPSERMAAWESHRALEAASPFKDLSWRAVGPMQAGARVEAIAVPPGEPSTIYVGVGSGNLWKTENNGVTWTPVFDHESTFTIGDVAVSASDPKVVWVGTGETQPRHSGYSYAGTGVFRSTDGGESWESRGLHDTHHIGTVLIHPTNPDVVYVAALGHFWTPNDERGVFRTTDGGESWERVLFVSDHTGVVEMAMDPDDPRILYAAAWEAVSGRPVEGGEESGLYRSTDGGDSWEKLGNGLPEGPMGRMGIGVAPSQPNTVYVFLDNQATSPVEGRPIVGGEVYRSNDRGNGWRKVNEDDLYDVFGIYGWKFTDIRVSPEDPEEIFILGNRGFHSTDGGRTYQRIGETIVRVHDTQGEIMHLDQHEIWIDPLNPDRVLLGNDGGLFQSWDRGRTWLHFNNIPAAEFYAVATDRNDPYRIFGGTQDNAALFGPGYLAVRDVLNDPWENVYLDQWTGGDSFDTYPDPTDERFVYYEHQHGALRRMDITDDRFLTSAAESIRPRLSNADWEWRSGWYTPFIISHYDPRTLYMGGNRLIRSTDRGDTWEPVSPDLSDPPGGMRAAVPFGTITMISESPLRRGLIYVGTEGGSIWRTQDTGATWNRVGQGLPAKWVSRVVASAHQEGRVYATFTGFREDDFRAYIFRSDDYGETWQSIVANLPAESVNVIGEDPRFSETLYLGTDMGVYVSGNGGGSWYALSADLPTTPVHDLEVQPQADELVIGTHGRSVFVLDLEGVRRMLPFMNPDLPLEERVEDLLGRMTLDEKVSQTLYTSPAIPRLGIPAYNWWNEALHGVARAGIATVFPQAIGLGATWDQDLLLRVATAISDEARAKHHQWIREGHRGIYEGLTFWSPNINIFRDPRWGRGMETYGEDPYLTGKLAVAFVRGMQGDDPHYLKTVATPKHYAVHSGPEPDRHSFDAVVDERDLRETYLPAFRASVVEGGAESVMCAYNAFRGYPACASGELLQDILRGEWGFQGYVVSDCWAITDIYNTHEMVETAQEAAAMAMDAGTDLNCGVSFQRLAGAVEEGLLSERTLDEAVRRLLRARFRLGMFDPPDRVPWADTPYSVNDSEEHRALALEAARKSMVLLKNEGGVLPLDRGVGTIAVVGPNADDVGVLLGNYNGYPSDPVTPLQGILEKASEGTRVLYGRGVDLAENLPFLETVPGSALRPEVSVRGRSAGLTARYFSNPDFAGDAFATRIDDILDFRWWGTAPLPGLEPGSFSVRWTGTLIPPVSGTYALGGRGLGRYRVFVDDSLVADFNSEHEINARWAKLEMEAGRPLALRVDFRPRRPDAAMELVWARPWPGLEAQALDAVEAADVVVMVLGLSPRLEGEEMRVDVPGFAGGDRQTLGLPEVQERFVERVADMGKPVVLVLMNGSAMAIPWAAEHVPAIVEAWYPGQAGGSALADILFGDYNPAGRLPVTFYRSVEDLPPFSDYAMEGRTYKYFRGEPLFPFGHGLSYTTFTYGHLEVPATVEAGEAFQVSVTVGNTGERAGEEVVQLYLTDEDSSFPVPIRSLQGVKRIHLEAGGVERVTFTLAPEQLSLVTDEGERRVEPGWFRISIGGRQPPEAGVDQSRISDLITGRFRVVGGPLRDRTPLD